MTRREGLRVLFVGENGAQRHRFDFGTLAGDEQIREDLATAFETATGPLGTWKRHASAQELWWVAGRVAQWMDAHRPDLRRVGHLTAGDVRQLALSFRTSAGDRRVSALRALLDNSPITLPVGVLDVLSRFRTRNAIGRQPYTDDEFRRISVSARGIARRARDRLRAHWALVADHDAGRLGDLDRGHPRRILGEALAYCAATGDIPRSLVNGKPSMLAQHAAAAAEGHPLMTLLHPNAGEAWAFAVLLVGLTGLNASVLDELPAPHLRAHAPGEPGIGLVDVNKPRRGARSAMTLPVTALAADFRPPERDARPSRVVNTSLTTAYGALNLLIELTEPTRRQLGSTRALVYYRRRATVSGESPFAEGLPKLTPGQRKRWLSRYLTGDSARDALLLEISLDRLRKSYLERHRRPVAHTPATLAGYLSRMRMVTEEGFQIVREALDEQVEHALTRRKMTVDTDASGERETSGHDTVLGECRDLEHSPLDDGQRCRRSFLDCLDCSNARALPHHLPLQLLVLDELNARRQEIGLQRWVGEYAGRAAQLDDIVNEFEPAQRLSARAQITDEHRRLVTRLFTGDLDAL